LLALCRRGSADEASKLARRHVLEVKRGLLRLLKEQAGEIR